MFASTARLDVQLGNGWTVVVKKLSGKQLSKAEQLAQKAYAEIMQEMGSEVIESFRREVATAENQPDDATEEERHSQWALSYDQLAVLKAGIVSWTGPPDRESPEVCTESIEDLTAPEAKQLFEAILDFTFDSEADRKKD